MEPAPRPPQREAGLDRIAALMAGLDPDAERARDRLERAIGSDLAALLVAALSHRRDHIPLDRWEAAAA